MSSAPPLSLALNRPELPRGETEPEIMLLNNRQANSTSDDRFIHIMVTFWHLYQIYWVGKWYSHDFKI